MDNVKMRSYRPACKVMLERYYWILNSMFGKIMEENQRDWDTKVPFVMAAYMASVHDATGYTPNFLALGIEVRVPLDVILGPPKENTGLWESHNYFVANQQEPMRSAYDMVKENLFPCAVRRKKTYHLRVKKQDIQRRVWM